MPWLVVAISVSNVGYPALFALIAMETMGIPLPGETALFTAGVLSHNGKLSIEIVIVLAACAAILGDNVGFALGRHFGRRVFEKPGPYLAQRLQLLEVGEPFFERHGPKAVFLGRWVSGLRIASAWLAGMNKMRWPTFLVWNALGGICWAVTIGLGAYFIGHAFEDVVGSVGLVAAGVVTAAIAAFFGYRHYRHRRAVQARVREIKQERAAAALDDGA